MTQSDFGNLESPLSGTALINTHLEPFRNALHTSHSGSSRPSYAQAGMIWLDTSTTPWLVKMFDGSDDITLGRVNATNNWFEPSGIVKWAATVGGTANAITLTPTIALSAYAAGIAYEFIVGTTNTSEDVTVNISGLGTVNLKCSVGGGKVKIPIGALQSGMVARIVHDGTDVLLLNVRAHNESASIATASTVNLDSATGDYIELTGTTTVTAFTLARGVEKTIKCGAIFQITDSSGDSPPGIITPGGGNITAAVGDVFVIRGESNGTTRIIAYHKADGTAIVGGTQIMHVQHHESQGTDAGTLNNAVYNTRPLNQEVTNTIPGASLASNLITLPAGTYDIDARAQSFASGVCFLRLYNVDDASQIMKGQNAETRSATATQQNILMRGRFTLAAEKDIRLDHYSAGAQTTNGMGQANNISGQTEIYADVRIEKVA